MTGDKSVIVTGDALKTLQRISDNYTLNQPIYIANAEATGSTRPTSPTKHLITTA